MLIANPIYDAVFKYLLEDTDIARKLLSVIIGEEIVEIEVKPQENTALSEQLIVRIFRLDFKATVLMQTGERRKILIELQKGKQLVDIMRFRKYLGNNYLREDDVQNDDGKLEKQALPIITIYFLGFVLQNVGTAVLKVNRVYRDVLTNEELTVREEFVEKLTHDSYIIQIPRLQIKMQNRLERLLMFFNQKFITDDVRLLNVPTDSTNDDLIRRMTDRLATAALSAEMQEKLAMETGFDAELENFARRKAAEADALREKLAAAQHEIDELKRRLGDKEK